MNNLTFLMIIFCAHLQLQSSDNALIAVQTSDNEIVYVGQGLFPVLDTCYNDTDNENNVVAKPIPLKRISTDLLNEIY